MTIVIIYFEKNKKILKYLLSAIIIVLFELFIFQVIYVITSSYKVATVISFSLAVVLNWLVSRYFVFNGSKYVAIKELSLVAFASLIGLVIQLLVIYVSIEKLEILPILAKVLSICFSFVWNYWFRAKYIFHSS